ncbi:MAG TPA: MMPL family transporter [Myxococcota bacterium]|nr:MMPL family transporter [Myxococcota bacterium]
MSERATTRFGHFVVRRRVPIAFLLILSTGFFFYPIANAIFSAAGHPLPGPKVRVGSDARAQLPDHPFIHAQAKFAGDFGNATPVAILYTVDEGTIYTPENLAKIDAITKSLDGWDYDPRADERKAEKQRLDQEGKKSKAEIAAELDRRFPPYPVNHDTVRSITHLSTRIIEYEKDGTLNANLLMENPPDTQKEADEIHRKANELMPDEARRLLVSPDEKAALITAGFVTDRLSSLEVYRAVFDHLMALQKREADDKHHVYITGAPLAVGYLLAHSREIGLSVVAAVFAIFALLWAYFRRWHGVLIPMVAAFATVIWGTGFTGWAGIAFDPLVLVIPMLITARAVSHTVQMAERFFEDYERLFPIYGDAERAKLEAAAIAMGELIVPGTLGILTDVAGLLVILVTTIPQMRDLGVFGAFWVAAIVVTVEILHPILICFLPAPKESRHYTPAVMRRLVGLLGDLVTHPVGRWAVVGAFVAIFLGSAAAVAAWSTIGEAKPGIPLFWPNHPFNQAIAKIGEKFGGADNLTIYAEADRDDGVEDHDVLVNMQSLERKLKRETGAVAVVSPVQIVRVANRQFRNGEPKQEMIPDGAAARAFLIFIRLNSSPGALSSIINVNGRVAQLTAFYPDHKGPTIRRAIETAEKFIADNPMGAIQIRLDEHHAAPGAPPWDRERVTDFFYYMIGPLLPARAHTLKVLRQQDHEYVPFEVKTVAKDGLPPWIDDFRQRSVDKYAKEKQHVKPGHSFVWPARLANWDPKAVDQWFENDELRIRAVSVNTQDLIVDDQKSKGAAPTYQPTQTWTRGVQFILAGGALGTLAAVNDEVERGHLANISLILFVIFVLHSVTYRSAVSGGIIFLQLATATLLSLAYMAVRGVGLNINTLPVQAVGVGVGVDYAIYIVDRIRQEMAVRKDLDEAIRTAVRTTGMAVTFTGTTVVGGIGFWVFSNLRFQAEMAQLLIVLMAINMLAAVTLVPALYSILRPGVASSLLRRDEAEDQAGAEADAAG